MPTGILTTPGISAGPSISPRMIFSTINPAFSPNWEAINARIIGALTRDPGQTPNGFNTSILREGLVLGKITGPGTASTQYGGYGNAIIGITKTATTNPTSSGTLGTTAEVVTEITRLMGTNSSYNAVVVGPPTATGTVAVLSATFSASTGSSLTYSAGNGPSAVVVAGSYICPGDGRYLPVTVLSGTLLRTGVDVTDLNGNSVDQQLPAFLRSASFRTSMIINALADDNANAVNAPCLAWLKAQLGSRFTWDDDR